MMYILFVQHWIQFIIFFQIFASIFMKEIVLKIVACNILVRLWVLRLCWIHKMSVPSFPFPSICVMLGLFISYTLNKIH